jgi:hypothetical protein
MNLSIYIFPAVAILLMVYLVVEYQLGKKPTEEKPEPEQEVSEEKQQKRKPGRPKKKAQE